MFGSRVEKALAAEVLFLRAELQKANERVDRLTEALARKNDLALVMPQAERPNFATGRVEKEKSLGWFDVRPPERPKTPGGTKQ